MRSTVPDTFSAHPFPLIGLGGSQVPGPGYVRAFVGGNSGATSFSWVNPSTGNLTATLDNYVIAGDKTTPSTVFLDQPVGPQAQYDIPASATGTVHGNPNAVVTISANVQPGRPATGLVALTWTDPNTNTTVTGTTIQVTLDGNGNTTFGVQSLGNEKGGLSIPLTLTSADAYTPSQTQMTIALIPVNVIAQACDQAKQLGWAVASGNANGSVVNMGADIAFSTIPVVGSYTDIRDITKEMLKLVPGYASSEDRFSWSTTLLSGTGLLLVGFPPFKWVPSVAKKLLPLLRADSIIGNAFQKFALRCDFSKLADSRSLVQRMIDPSEQAQAFCKAADNVCVADANFNSLIATYKAFGANADDFEVTFLRIVNDPELGLDAARKVVGDLSKLSADQLNFLCQTGRLDNFANNVARGDWSADNLQEAVTAAQSNWLKPDGTWWPPDRGFMPGAKETTLAKGTMIDRYGFPGGYFASPAGTPYPARAMAPGSNASNRPFTTYEVVKPVEGFEGRAIPWFDEPGGGLQIEFQQSIEALLNARIIKEVIQ